MSSNAYWESQDPWIVSIERDGKATALEIGQTSISNKGDVVLTSQVYVSKVNLIEISQKLDPFTNIRENSRYKDTYIVPLKLYLSDSLDELTSEVY